MHSKAKNTRPHHQGKIVIYQCFTFTEQDKIAHLTFNRPDALNTMQPVFWRELGEILHQPR
jgi:enoyl-CoA hydratase/carnithine racemase